MLLLRRVGAFVARRSGWRKGGSRSDPVASPPAPRTTMPRAVAHIALPAPDLHELEAEARYHRDRLALYRARVLSAKPTSAARLRELQQISTAADTRLRHAAKRDGADAEP
jgi:hypothetical protein